MAIAGLLALMVGACSSSAGTSTTIPDSTRPPSTTTVGTAPDTTRGTVATTTTTTTTDEVLRFEFVVSTGVVDGPSRLEIPLGAVVELTVESDVADELHLHGYDLTLDLEAGVPGILELTASIPGIFEIELESSRVLITELEVAP